MMNFNFSNLLSFIPGLVWGKQQIAADKASQQYAIDAQLKAQEGWQKTAQVGIMIFVIGLIAIVIFKNK